MEAIVLSSIYVYKKISIYLYAYTHTQKERVSSICFVCGVYLVCKFTIPDFPDACTVVDFKSYEI